MFALTPWSLARRARAGRRAVLLLVLAALLYGFGMHAARACVTTPSTAAHHAASHGGPPCHGAADADVDVAGAACEAHCRTDTQTGRSVPNFDLAAVMPPDLAAGLAPEVPADLSAPVAAPPRRDSGPPLHILLQRLLN
jgi:hypothetical protein